MFLEGFAGQLLCLFPTYTNQSSTAHTPPRKELWAAWDFHFKFCQQCLHCSTSGYVTAFHTVKKGYAVTPQVTGGPQPQVCHAWVPVCVFTSVDVREYVYLWILSSVHTIHVQV